MKIAIYKTSGTEILFEASEYMENNTAFVRLSEIAEVNFQMLPPEVTIPNQIAAIDQAERELRNKFQQALDQLNTERANLLALTHEEAA